MVVGNVEVTVTKVTRSAPPEGAKTKETDVLNVLVKLNLKQGATKEVSLTSWMDESLQNKVSLTDAENPKKTFDLLDQVPADKGSDGKAITKRWMKVYLLFDPPTDKKVKSLKLKLPAAAFQPDGPMMGFKISASDIDSAKPAETEKADKTDKADEGEK